MMVVVFTFIGNYNPVQRILTKILVIPLVMGISYEVFRLPLRYPDNPVVRVLTAPGLWLQRITTQEPNAAQIEVAIAALLQVPDFPGAKLAENHLPAGVINEADLQKLQKAAKQTQPA